MKILRILQKNLEIFPSVFFADISRIFILDRFPLKDYAYVNEVMKYQIRLNLTDNRINPFDSVIKQKRTNIPRTKLNLREYGNFRQPK